MQEFRLVTLLICGLAVSGDSPDNNNHYDLIVLGGGSGGLAAAKDAYLKYKKKVLVIDYVKPTLRGTQWGVGGTCVNVGCIPKKLMHQAALIGEAVQEANAYGWEIKDPENIKLNWAKLVIAVQNHVRSVNFVTRTQLMVDSTRKVTEYLNGQAEFVDANTVKVTLKDRMSKKGELSQETRTVTGDKILIAVGGRPRLLDTPGVKEYTITSDDLFSLKKPPGRTLIVGAGYIGLECAGFLRAMGMDVSVMVRSEVLREMDAEMAKLVKDELIVRGVKFIERSQLISIEEQLVSVIVKEEIPLFFFGSKTVKNAEVQRMLGVKWKTHSKDGDKEGWALYETVVMATGRDPVTADLKLENANVKVKRNGKIDTVQEQTNVPNIYAVGDVLYDKPELTPVAIQAGKLLVDRLYGGSEEQMDYEFVPTTVFTPLEYSFVGLTEKKANDKYGEDNIEVYHTKFSPVEYSVPRKGKARCYLKVICERQGDQKILGLHFFGPSAGEVMQGYAAALKAGLTFQQLRATVGIHPTASEEFTRLYITKRSGQDPTPQSCCS